MVWSDDQPSRSYSGIFDIDIDRVPGTSLEMPEAGDRHAGRVFGVAPFEILGRDARPELARERGRQSMLARIEPVTDMIEHSHQEGGFLLHRGCRPMGTRQYRPSRPVDDRPVTSWHDRPRCSNRVTVLLSYRHGFHAGNLADVLKHSTLIAVLDAAITKPTPLAYIDTHAGAGVYSLGDDGEHCSGIAPLHQRSRDAMPRSVARYLDCVGSFNTTPSIRRYPGSAMIAAHLLRDGDRLLLCERHPADHLALADALRADPRVQIECTDGYAQLKAALPPRERRGVVLIDPAYELADEPMQLIDGLQSALARFGHGVYLVWYPLHGKHDPAVLKRRFKRLAPPKTLNIELDPRQPASRGATGSGLMIVNPPYQAVAEIELLTSFLGRALAPDGRAVCEWLVPE